MATAIEARGQSGGVRVGRRMAVGAALGEGTTVVSCTTTCRTLDRQPFPTPTRHARRAKTSELARRGPPFGLVTSGFPLPCHCDVVLPFLPRRETRPPTPG